MSSFFVLFCIVSICVLYLCVYCIYVYCIYMCIVSIFVLYLYLVSTILLYIFQKLKIFINTTTCTNNRCVILIVGGVFGADIQVHTHKDGLVAIPLETCSSLTSSKNCLLLQSTLVFNVVNVLSIIVCLFSLFLFCHCIICPSSIYRF